MLRAEGFESASIVSRTKRHCEAAAPTTALHAFSRREQHLGAVRDGRFSMLQSMHCRMIAAVASYRYAAMRGISYPLPTNQFSGGRSSRIVFARTPSDVWMHCASSHVPSMTV